MKISKKISAIIWSKDRAMQLYCLIETLMKYTNPIFDITVVWTSSNDTYLEGYNLCFKKLKEIIPIENVYEDDTFEKETKSFLDKAHQYTCFLCDDNIFFKPCRLYDDNIDNIMVDDVLCFSPRLGFNTIMQDCYTATFQPPLKDWVDIDKNLIKWKFKDHKPNMNYGYPFALDGHIFRTKELIDILSELSFPNTNVLEGTLQSYATDWIRPYIVAHRHSIMVNTPINRIQRASSTNSGVYHYADIETLNETFLCKATIDTSKMNFSEIIGCHQELELKFK